jgi:hypothetical protein
MSECVTVGSGDKIKILLNDGESLTIPVEVLVMAGGAGVAVADRFIMPMKNIDKVWYETTQSPYFEPYNVHPHRCEDYNLESGGNTDLGEPLVAPFSGLVLTAAQYGGGIGRVVQILGRSPEGASFVWGGWHLEELSVASGQIVHIGDDIGTIGDADGRYAGAHLHNQVCVLGSKWGIPSPTTFPTDNRYDWEQPSKFFLRHGVDKGLVERLMNWDSR